MPVKRPVFLTTTLVTLAMILSACATSRVPVEANVLVTGTVLGEAGQPAAGADVALFRIADVGELLVGATLAIGTLGVACFVDDAPPVCRGARKTKSDAAGRFSYSMKGGDTQGSVANASDFDLTAVVRRSSGDPLVASVRFKIQRTELEVPALRVWDASATLTSENGSTRASWPSLPGDYGSSPNYRVRFLDSSGGTVWSVDDASPGQAVDFRLLEDRRGTVEVGATTSEPGPDTTFRFEYFARPAPFSGPGSPPSRGVPCAAATTDGRVTPLEPCPLSDGDLARQSGFSADGVVRSAAYLDLGEYHPVSLVVSRGALGTTSIETSTDAVTWIPMGTGTGRLVSAQSPNPVSSRYVRIRTTNNVDLSPLVEVSAWY